MTKPRFFDMRSAGWTALSGKEGSRFEGFSLGSAFAVARRYAADEIEEPIQLTPEGGGPIADVSFGDAFVPIVRRRVTEAIAQLGTGDVQIYRCDVEHVPEPFDLLNLTHISGALDEQKAIFDRTRPGELASKFGRYKNIVQLVLDPDRVGPHDIFRVEGMSLAGVVVSARLAEILQALKATGVTFSPVG